MPSRLIDEQIEALRKKQKALMEESEELERKLASLEVAREALGVVDDTRILAKPDILPQTE